MQRERLTPERIRRFTCAPGKKQEFLWDTDSPRLAVRATAGAKSFVFESKIDRHTVRITIGDVRAWPLESVWEGKGSERREVQRGAREEANRLQGLINQGIDPRQEKVERLAAVEAKRDEAKRQEVTVAEAWAAYIDARSHKWSARHLDDHHRIAQAGGTDKKRGKGKIEAGPLAELMPLRLADLTPNSVAAWLKRETEHRPTYASLAYRLLRAFMRWSAGHDEFATVTDANAVGARVTKDNLPRAKAKEADCLQREQLPGWFKAVRELANPVQAAYLQALLLTGARREEMASLQWADVDFQWRSLTIGDKVEGERIIPLTPYLASLLACLPRRTMEVDGKTVANPWVFSSPTAVNGRLQEPRIVSSGSKLIQAGD